MKTTFFLMLAMLFAGFISAQSGAEEVNVKIRGELVAPESGEPLAGVKVIVVRGDAVIYEAMTDREGEFFLYFAHTPGQSVRIGGTNNWKSPDFEVIHRPELIEFIQLEMENHIELEPVVLYGRGPRPPCPCPGPFRITRIDERRNLYRPLNEWMMMNLSEVNLAEF